MGILEIFTKKPLSKDNAKARLKVVIEQDRLRISNDVLERLKNDILRVISNYVEIDTDDLDVRISQSGDDSPIIKANIPVKEFHRNR
ncbi:MAG: cell division topological specificity factor MinE [Clostridiales bacterium]|jgi:cell division topological specificity factor|nr:cell division topological specificity factor MinE [Clostridiales bacterium]